MELDPSGGILPQALIVLFLVFFNAFFAAAEMAIVSLNKNRINTLADGGDKRALQLKKLMDEPSRFLATIQVGVTLAGFFASASGAVSISGKLAGLLEKANIPYSDHIAIIIVTLIIAYISLVFGELFPKRIALQKSEQVALYAAKPLTFVSKITLPFVKLLSKSTNALVKLVGLDVNKLEEDGVSEEEILYMIQTCRESGVINETEKEMINSIFEFDDKLAREVMTPRTEVFLINVDTPSNKILDEIIGQKYSRIPVYEDNIDNIIGILYIKDVFIEAKKSGLDNINIRGILRPAYFAPETKNIDRLFKELQNGKNHMAILIDEYGGFSGIATMEDLIEEIMGNIFDEYDENEPDIKKLDDETYIVDGLLTIDEVNENLDLDLKSENADTIGGFVMDLMGSIPCDVEESLLEYENLVFKIEKLDEKRIEKLKICIQGDI